MNDSMREELTATTVSLSPRVRMLSNHDGPRFPAPPQRPLLDEVDVLLHPDVPVERPHAALGVVVLPHSL